jgi:serine/threonine protein kinase/tetratricopeptide (TPR) repeat protein
VNDLTKEAETQRDLGPVDARSRTKEAFEAAWNAALKGALPPEIHVFLVALSEAERPTVQGMLEEIDRDYRQRLAAPASRAQADLVTEMAPPLRKDADGDSAKAQTVADCGPSCESRAAPGGTVNIGAATSHDVADDGFALREPSPVETLAYRAGDLPDSTTRAWTIDGAAASKAQRAAVTPAKRLSVPGYQILGELGRGGMGVVYKARQTGLNRTVALKMVLAGAHASADQIARFFIEAEAVASFQHPQIVQIFEVGEHAGLPYFSLEFVDGGSLAQRIDGKPMPPKIAAELTEKLARGMFSAHERQIVHRDLKPANVLLTADGEPKITDFGLAKRLESDSKQTATGTLMGTPNYMAPEQARGDGQQIGPHSDQYALGAILYEMLTGRPPFQGTTVVETLEQVRTQEPVPPTRFQPRLPRDLETICLKGLQKEAHKRYPTCEAMADDVRRFLDGVPIHARPVGAPERIWRWCRRNPRIASLSAAVLLLLVSLSVTGAAVAKRMSREQHNVVEAKRLARERLQQASESISVGNYHRARDLLNLSDPLLASTPALAREGAELERLRTQVRLFAEFRRQLDKARFDGLAGRQEKLSDAQRDCRQLLALYDRLERRTDDARFGLPSLGETQKQLFQEDLFDTFLIASTVDWNLVADGRDVEAQRLAARQGIAWLNRAEKLLPPTKALYVRRSDFWEKLNNTAMAEADKERANSIAASSAVDHFWHGYAEYLRGVQAKQRGDARASQESFRTARDEFAAVLQQRPEHFWAYFEWALCHFQLGDLSDAMVGFTACIHIDPESPWPYHNRGTMHFLLKQYDQAIQDETAALNRNPEYDEAHYSRGVANLAKKDLKAALDDFNHVVRLNPNNASAFIQRADLLRNSKQLDQAVRDYDRAIGLDPKKAAPAYFARAAIRVSRGELTQARDDYSAVIGLHPLQAEAFRNRTIVNIRLKDFGAALADGQQHAVLQPQSAEARYRIGLIEHGLRHFDKALTALDEAIQLKGDYMQALLTRAQVYHQQGQFSQALEDLDLVLGKLSPGNPGILNDRGDLYRAMGRPELAEADYSQSVKGEPKQVDAYIGLALLAEQQGKTEQAAKWYDAMVAADPGAARAYWHRAEYRRDQGSYADALADCEQAARLDQRSTLPGLVRASIKAAQGEHQEAVADAQRLLEAAPEGDGHALWAAACVWSVASQAVSSSDPETKQLAQSYAERASSLLAEALSKGFHDLNYQEQNRLIDDPALRPILADSRLQPLLPKQGE